MAERPTRGATKAPEEKPAEGEKEEKPGFNDIDVKDPIPVGTNDFIQVKSYKWTRGENSGTGIQITRGFFGDDGSTKYKKGNTVSIPFKPGNEDDKKKISLLCDYLFDLAGFPK